jgi:hypothetical protein
MNSTTYATVPSHTLAVVGHPNNGWSVVERQACNGQELEFTFAIQDDGADNFLLVYSSLDGRFAADTWHETLEEVYECAESEFGVKRSEWVAVDEKKPGPKRGNNVA